MWIVLSTMILVIVVVVISILVLIDSDNECSNGVSVSKLTNPNFKTPEGYFDYVLNEEVDNPRIKVNSRFKDKYFGENHYIDLFLSSDEFIVTKTDSVISYSYRTNRVSLSEYVFDKNNVFLEYRFYIIEGHNHSILAYRPKVEVKSYGGYNEGDHPILINMCLSSGVVPYPDMAIPDPTIYEITEYFNKISDMRSNNPNIFLKGEFVDEYFGKDHYPRIFSYRHSFKGFVTQSLNRKDVQSVSYTRYMRRYNRVIEDIVIQNFYKDKECSILEYRIYTVNYYGENIVVQIPKVEYRINTDKYKDFDDLRSVCKLLGIVVF